MKTLNIEWKHLEKDGLTCARCGDTGRGLRQTVSELRRCLRPRGVTVRLVETKLAASRLQESNQILLNGLPLETVLGGAQAGYSDCASCGDLLKEEVQCRTVERQSDTHETIPAKLIWEAACRVVGCNCTPARPQHT